MQALSSYLEGRKKGEFARSIGIVPAYLSQILSGEKRPSFDLMCKIERETKGKVALASWRSDTDIQDPSKKESAA